MSYCRTFPRVLYCSMLGTMLMVSLLLTAMSPFVSAQQTPVPQDTATAKQKLQLLGTIRDKQIDESSGLAIGANTQQAFWTLNDSGHDAELFLISMAPADAGKTKLVCKLKDAKNIDWEAMASFKRDQSDYLLVADVGDNSLNRTSYCFYLLEEPVIATDPGDVKETSRKQPQKLAVPATKIVFRYEDGPHNCEAMGVDPLTNEAWLIEKIYSTDPRKIQSGIYRVALPSVSQTREQVAFRIGDFPIRNVTGLSFSPDGTKLIVRNYLNAHLYTRPDKVTWEETVRTTRPVAVALPLQSQGEAICFTKDSKAVIITSEFKRSTIWKVGLE